MKCLPFHAWGYLPSAYLNAKSLVFDVHNIFLSTLQRWTEDFEIICFPKSTPKEKKNAIQHIFHDEQSHANKIRSIK